MKYVLYPHLAKCNITTSRKAMFKSRMLRLLKALHQEHGTEKRTDPQPQPTLFSFHFCSFSYPGRSSTCIIHSNQKVQSLPFTTSNSSLASLGPSDRRVHPWENEPRGKACTYLRRRTRLFGQGIPEEPGSIRSSVLGPQILIL